VGDNVIISYLGCTGPSITKEEANLLVKGVNFLGEKIAWDVAETLFLHKIVDIGLISAAVAKVVSTLSIFLDVFLMLVGGTPGGGWPTEIYFRSATIEKGTAAIPILLYTGDVSLGGNTITIEMFKKKPIQVLGGTMWVRDESSRCEWEIGPDYPMPPQYLAGNWYLIVPVFKFTETGKYEIVAKFSYQEKSFEFDITKVNTAPICIIGDLTGTWQSNPVTLTAQACDLDHEDRPYTSVEFWYSTDGTSWQLAGVDATPAPFQSPWSSYSIQWNVEDIMADSVRVYARAFDGMNYSPPSVTGPFDIDAGDTFDAATAIGPENFMSTIVGTDVDDYYKIHMNAGDVIGVGMAPPTTADFDLYLYDPSHTLIALSTQRGNGLAESISYTAASSGDRYIRVTKYSDTGTYSMSFVYQVGSFTFSNAADSGTQHFSLPYHTQLRITASQGGTLSGGSSSGESIPASTSENPSVVWNVTYNSGDDRALGVAVDSSGNVYVTGYSYTGANYDFRTIKYNSSGSVIWNVTYNSGSDDGTHGDEAHGIAVDSSGNVYVTGYSWNGSNYDFRTIKYNSSGSMIWNVTYDSGSYEMAWDVAVDGSGNVYVTGDSWNADGTRIDFRTIKYNSSGSVIWNVTYDIGNTDRARGVAVDGSGNVYVTGYMSSYPNDGYHTIKYNSSGSVIWSVVSGEGCIKASGVAVDGSGNVYVTGGSASSSCYYRTIKYNQSGSKVWDVTYDSGTNADYANDIAVDGSGNVYVTGNTWGIYNDDYRTIKYNSSGSEVWNVTYNGGSVDSANSIAVDGSGNVYITGESRNTSNYDYRTIKYSQNQAPTAPTSLLCEGQTNPTGVTDTTPEFSAIYNDQNSGDSANYYRVIVGTSPGSSNMWDSGKTSMLSTNVGNRCQDISYSGASLSLNGATYYWQIKFWDVGGLEGAWSSVRQFTMATPSVLVYWSNNPNMNPIVGQMSMRNLGDNIWSCDNIGLNLGWVGKTIYWQVYVTSTTGENAWSPIYTGGLITNHPILLVSPVDGACTNDNTPTFEWTPIDHSTITYQLQCSTDPSFETATTIEGLGENSYTLPDENVLPENTYYWRVRAVDGASNTGDWSDVWEFTVDTTPPASSVDAISPYWRTSASFSVTATASDVTSGVENVELFYRYSSDNVTWGDWTSFGVNTAPSWSWSFTAENGDGYYEFYSIATDVAGNVESAPASADAICGVDTVAPPAPSLVSPTDGTITINNTPTFEWTSVSDPSGVTYTLEIVEQLTKTGLTDNTYTLTGAEALPHGTYSWHVRAVDGAGNVGDWSEEWNLGINQPPIAENQKAEGQVNPTSLTTSAPSLSWSYFDSDGDVQTQRQIQVGTSADGSDMWDSTVSTSATAATYAGAPLSTLPVYYWRVMVFDGYEWSSDWLSGGTFRLVVDIKPNKPTNLSPSTRQTTENVTISAFVTDNNGDRMNVFFYDNAGTKPLIGNVWANSGTTASVTWYGLVRGQTYGFFVGARDSNWMLWGDNSSAQSFKVNKLPIADNLKAENRVKPDNLTTSTPYLGWKYFDNNTDNQAKYQVQVGTSENASDMWDSGEVSSKDNSVKYAGSVLSSGVTYYWRVKVFDNYEWSNWRYENGTFKLKPNIKPNKPTNLLPSTRQTTTSVTISAFVTDNNGDSMYVFFYDNKTKFLIGNVWTDNGTTASVTWYGLVMGQTYAFFARAQDNNLAWGDNSSAQSFKVNVNMLPIADNLKAENRVKPDNLTTLTPLLSWSYFDNDKENQTKYWIRVGTDNTDPLHINDMWDSGEVSSSAKSATYAGAPLSLNTMYYWRVMVFDGYDWSSWRYENGTFKLKLNIKPNKPTNLLPSGRQTYTTSVTISALVTDNTGNKMNVAFYDNSNKSIIGWDNNKDNGATAQVLWENLKTGKTYAFFVGARDHDNDNLRGDNSSAQSFKVNKLPIADNLKAENRVAPENLTTSIPTLSWSYFDNDKDNQTKYWIRVGTDNTDPSHINDMWDSGQVISSAKSATYAGSALLNNVMYYWRVKVYDNWEASENWRYENGRFKLKIENIKPNKPTNLSPSTRQTTTDVTISAFVTDNNYSSMRVFFYDNKTKLQIDNVLANSVTTASVVWHNLTKGQTYAFFARAQDQDNLSLWGDNSSAQSFKVNKLPIADNLKAENRVKPDNLTALTPSLSWSYFDNDKDNQTGYQIQVGTSENASDKWDSGQVISSSKSATYAGTLLTLGQTYHWRVKVFDNYEWSNWWYENGTFTLKTIIKPNKPTNLSPSARQTTTDVTISALVTDNTGNKMNVAFYDNSNKSIIGWDNDKDNGATASVVWSNLTKGKTYAFFVGARDHDNDNLRGDNSSAQSFKVNKLPIADNLKAENRVAPENLTTSIPTLSWSYFDNDKDNQTKYWIQVGTLENGSDKWDSGQVISSAKSATYAGTLLTLGQTYHWRVMVFDNYEWSNWRYENGTFTLKTIIKPNKPTNLSPSGRQTYTTSVTISAFVTDNTGNKMNVAFYDNSTKSIIGWDNDKDNGVTASVVWPTLTTGKTYAFFARARDHDNTSLWGENSSVQSFKVNMLPIADNLKAENRVNPDNLTIPTPLLSWSYFDNDKDSQTQRQIQVGTSANGNDVWDSTVPTSATAATYAGAPLSVGQTYYWRVRVFDNYEWSNWRYENGRFKLTENNIKPNKPDGLSPSARQTATSVTISATVTDNNGDSMYVFFYDNKTKLQIDNVLANSVTTASVVWHNLTKGQTYTFFARARDNNGAWGENSDTQSFYVSFGSGTSGDPYIITNVIQLQEMKDNLTAYYILGNDIDASDTVNWNEDPENPGTYYGFEPIGTLATRFTGSFDGQGYKIENLYINRPSTFYVGLFGHVGTGGVIENVGMENIDVTGNQHTGGLVGRNLGTVSNSYSTGPVSGYWSVGGLAGSNTGTVSNSYSTSSTSGYSEVGGLVGWSQGTVSNSYSTGTVTGTSSYIGGLIGHNEATVYNCYSTGSVSAPYFVGGLVGLNDYLGTVSNSYSTGPVSGTVGYVGGLVGSNLGTVTNSFWDKETSGRETSDGGTGKTTDNMKNVRTFTDNTWSAGLTTPWDFVGNPYGDVGNEDIWSIDPAINDGYPFFT
jgi:uncharacterized delta-60 repeat protein